MSAAGPKQVRRAEKHEYHLEHRSGGQLAFDDVLVFHQNVAHLIEKRLRGTRKSQKDIQRASLKMAGLGPGTGYRGVLQLFYTICPYASGQWKNQREKTRNKDRHKEKMTKKERKGGKERKNERQTLPTKPCNPKAKP